jgi:tetratricopeptide (TPR) repeat protein
LSKRRILLYTAAILLWPASAAAVDGYDAFFQAGIRAYQQRDIAAAAGDFYEAATLRPGSADALYGVAVCAYLLSERDSARRWAELSLARDPGAERTGQLLQRLGEPPDLVRAERALKSGRYAAALPLFRRAARLFPAGALAWRGEAECLARTGDAGNAEAALRRAEALEPENMDLPALRTLVEKAVDGFLRAADLAGLCTRRGVRLFRAGDLGGARRDFTRACALSPGDAQCWFHLALTCYKLGDGPATLEALQHCLALDPKHPGGLFLKAKYLQRTGQVDEAQDAFAALYALGDTQGYSALAGRALGAWPGSGAGGWHLYLRALAGPSSSRGGNGVSVTAQNSWSSQDYLHLGFDGNAASRFPYAFYYSAYLVPSGLSGAPLAWGQPYQSLDAVLRFRAGPDWICLGDWTGSTRQSAFDTLTYYSNSARVELDGRVLGLRPLALAAQALVERFPAYTPYNAASGVFTLSATRMDARGDVAVLGLGSRVNQAQDPLWAYDNASASLYGRLALPWRCSLSVTGIWQPQRYPGMAAASGPRVDVQRFLNPEFGRGFDNGLALFAGMQWSDSVSNLPLYSASDALAYAGFSWSR